MRKSLLKNLFSSYFKEPISPEEQQIIANWENENPDSIKRLVPPDEEYLEMVGARMLKNIHAGIQHPTPVAKLILTNPLFKIAAMLLIVSAFFYLFITTHASDNFITVKSPKGSKGFLLLPDSSKVWLNAGSVIRYSKAFNKKREIYLLDGEVYFDVKHDPAHPFVVLHNNVYVKVLGTAFNVKAYGVRDVRIAVTRGKVEVGAEHKAYTVLTPNKEIILEKNKVQNYHTRQIDARKVAGWKTNDVNLYDVSFEDIILSIEDNYNVTISYPETEMKNSISTIHYSSDQKLSKVLDIVKMIHGLTYTIKGKEVTLSIN